MIYLYVGIAILVLGGAAYLFFRNRSGQSSQEAEAELSEQTPENKAAEMEPEEEASRTSPARPATSAAAEAYRRAAAAPPTRGTSRTPQARPTAPAPRTTSRPAPTRPANSATRGASRQVNPEPPDDTATSKATYPITEYSTLSEDAKVQFMNAVWYRCENPYCNHTEFLDVHHIIDDGSNNLNNLIVLCPKCNALAHNNEITVEELKSWLVEREKRFKSDLDWPYR